MVIDPAYVYYGPHVAWHRDQPACDHYLQHSYSEDDDGLSFCYKCGLKAELTCEEANAYRKLMGYTKWLSRLLDAYVGDWYPPADERAGSSKADPGLSEAPGNSRLEGSRYSDVGRISEEDGA